MKKNNKGFSLIELIIVIAIMAVLVAVIAPNLTQYIGSSKKKTDRSNADTIQNVINTALSDFATAGSHDWNDYAQGEDNDIVLTKCSDIADIPTTYTTVKAIAEAGEPADKDNPTDQEKAYWEYKVYEGIQKYITGSGSSIDVPCKQDGKEYAVEIKAVNNSYDVTVKVKDANATP